jgi:DNA-binding IclR family transcriptional regulator
MDGRRGIGSVDTAMTILGAFAAASGPLSLTEVSQRTGMAASKLHRYLASLVDAGMLAQPERSGAYDLGPFATSLGLAGIARNDFVNRAADALPGLVAKTGATAMLSVWGGQGPTVVRWERGPNFIVTALGLGATLPLLNSATGRVFLAYLPAAMTASRLGPDRAAAKALAVETRRAGFATVGGDLIPGLHAGAAPVLDWQDEAAAVVTLIGTDPAVTRPDGPAISALRAACRGLSIPRP